MTKTETTIRFILGAVGMDIRPLAISVDVAINLMFFENVPMDEIYVTDDIYPEVASIMKTQYGKFLSSKTVARQVERLANLCWDSLVSRNLVMEYIGTAIKDIRAPRDVIFYLAYYIHLDTPYFVVMHDNQLTYS